MTVPQFIYEKKTFSIKLRKSDNAYDPTPIVKYIIL